MTVRVFSDQAGTTAAAANDNIGKVEDLLASHKVLEKELEQLKQKLDEKEFRWLELSEI